MPEYRTGRVDNGHISFFYCLYSDPGYLLISVNYFYSYDWVGGGNGLFRDRQVAFKDLCEFGASGRSRSDDVSMDQRSEDAMGMAAHLGRALVVHHVWAYLLYRGCPPAVSGREVDVGG